jgi:hypothetical protein
LLLSGYIYYGWWDWRLLFLLLFISISNYFIGLVSLFGLKQFISRNNCHYWKFNNLESFPVSQDSLFFDSDHLNVDGASVLSNSLAGYLKKYESATLGLAN